MRNRLIVLILVLLVIFMIAARKNEQIVNTLLGVVNPIKHSYTNFTREIEDKSQGYIHQKEQIQKLNRENILLRKHLLEQKNYIAQVKDLYAKIPSLERMPKNSVEIVQTISYVKLNSFSEVILTTPPNFEIQEEKLYGLIQNDVVAGVAQIRNSNLYASFTSNKKCFFSVYVGGKRAPGIVFGVNTNKMVVKFIPKWLEIEVGDEVITSGLDSIFFAGVPVGKVEKIEVESSYKIAYIKSYADVLHPDYFYLVTDASPSLVSTLDDNLDIGRDVVKRKDTDGNASDEQNISSIPSFVIEDHQNIVQTNDAEVNEEQLEVPVDPNVDKNKVKEQKPVKKRRRPQPKVENLDVF